MSHSWERVEVLGIERERDEALGEPPYVVARVDTRYGTRQTVTMTLETFVAEAEAMSSERKGAECSPSSEPFTTPDLLCGEHGLLETAGELRALLDEIGKSLEVAE